MALCNSCGSSHKHWKHYSLFSCKICLWNSFLRCLTQDLLSEGLSLCSSNACDTVAGSSIRLGSSNWRHNLDTAMMWKCCQDLQKPCCYPVFWTAWSLWYWSKDKGGQGKTVSIGFRMWLRTNSNNKAPSS